MDNPTQDRQMFEGDWKCAGCGAAITQLPFQPDGTRDLFCRDCYRSQKQDSRGGGGFNDKPRQMHQGNWKCSGCGKEISELPFDPGDREVQCKECYMASKG